MDSVETKLLKRGVQISFGVLFAVMLGSCGSPRTSTAPAREAPPVRNDTLLLPATGQVSVKVVPNHLLGEAKLPGGTIGDYEAKGKRYQLWVVRAESNQDAALLLLGLKNTMKDSAYIPHMGGYSGTHSGTPLYTFAKLKFLAGVVGLSSNDADPIARQLAARLQ